MKNLIFNRLPKLTDEEILELREFTVKAFTTNCLSPIRLSFVETKDLFNLDTEGPFGYEITVGVKRLEAVRRWFESQQLYIYAVYHPETRLNLKRKKFVGYEIFLKEEYRAKEL